MSGDTPGKPVGQPDDIGLWKQGQAGQQWRVAPDLLEEQIDKEEFEREHRAACAPLDKDQDYLCQPSGDQRAPDRPHLLTITHVFRWVSSLTGDSPGSW